MSNYSCVMSASITQQKGLGLPRPVNWVLGSVGLCNLRLDSLPDPFRIYYGTDIEI
jgi:hypothetical protein